MYNPWGSIVCAEQSMDCLDPYFAHGAIHGLRAQSTDYCAICESIDCVGQYTDCPNPYFAHNIYLALEINRECVCACVFSALLTHDCTVYILHGRVQP